MRYPLVFYTNRGVPKGHAACARGPIVLIRPEYRGDLGLLAHELAHVSLWFLTLGTNALWYRISRRYRLWAEGLAYRVQLQYSPGNAKLFAGFLATRYALGITQRQAFDYLVHRKTK
jgi:hypothetical protein